MVKKLSLLFFCISVVALRAEEQNILDVDLDTFIDLLEQVKRVPGLIWGYSEEQTFNLKEKGTLSLLYFKYHYEALCKQKNLKAIEATQRLFPKFNPHITPPSQTAEIILLGSDSNKAFEKYYTHEIDVMWGEQDRKRIIANIISPLITPKNQLFTFDTEEKEIKKETLTIKQLKKDFVTLIKTSSLNKTYAERLTKNKASMDAFAGQPIFKDLGISFAELLDLLKEKTRTPLESLVDALVVLERKIKASV